METIIKESICEYQLQKVQGKAIAQKQLTKSSEVAEYCRLFWGNDLEIYESFFMVTLNRQNLTTGYVKISQGGVFQTCVDMTLIAKYAIESLSPSIIIAHNHPSGNIEPSGADKLITQKIQEGLKLFDIRLLDHIILTKDGYTSFADSGLL